MPVGLICGSNPRRVRTWNLLRRTRRHCGRRRASECSHQLEEIPAIHFGFLLKHIYISSLKTNAEVYQITFSTPEITRWYKNLIIDTVSLRGAFFGPQDPEGVK
jgi:hypothetical protein